MGRGGWELRAWGGSYGEICIITKHRTPMEKLGKGGEGSMAAAWGGHEGEGSIGVS